MSSDELRIVLIGHSLQAKCAVGNALLNQTDGFKQFQCRQSFVAKRIVGKQSLATVGGRQLLVTLTPNLNTPSWERAAEETIKKYNQVVFVYVQAPGEVKINEKRSIKSVKNKYIKKQPMCFVTYYGKDWPIEDSFPENVLHAKSKDKWAFAKALLMDIGKAIRDKSGKSYTGPEEIESRQMGINLRPPSHTLSTQSTLVFAEKENTNEFQLKDTLEEKDVALFTKTLKFGRANSNHVRVNFIGNQSVGKTTLVKRLQNIDVKCPDNTQKPTEALEINQICSRCIETNGEKQWETNIMEDYTAELNEQRMAHAMKNIMNAEAKSLDGDADCLLVDELQQPDYMLRSHIAEDVTAAERLHYFQTCIEEIERTNYIHKILRKRIIQKGRECMFRIGILPGSLHIIPHIKSLCHHPPSMC